MIATNTPPYKLPTDFLWGFATGENHPLLYRTSDSTDVVTMSMYYNVRGIVSAQRASRLKVPRTLTAAENPSGMTSQRLRARLLTVATEMWRPTPTTAGKRILTC